MTGGQVNEVDYHAAAWSRFERRLEVGELGTCERVRGIPPRKRLLRSIEWGVWRAGRDWDVLVARAPKGRRGRRERVYHGRVGTELWP
ncbi:MAG TPA: hypothetical protein VIV58_21970 [Kofleriaceae bacterium]